MGEGQFSPYISHVISWSTRIHNQPRPGFTPPSRPFMPNRVSDNAHKFILLFCGCGRRIKPNFYFPAIQFFCGKSSKFEMLKNVFFYISTNWWNFENLGPGNFFHGRQVTF
jgi:hypothetical protein